MGLTPNKDLNQLIERAEKQGWVVTVRNNNHLKWTAPNGGVVFTGFTPSDRRVTLNITKDLRKYGFIVVSRKGKK
jgi:predicted RNA binding protein YcfA (HicA-like mRNA interferase family)